MRGLLRPCGGGPSFKQGLEVGSHDYYEAVFAMNWLGVILREELVAVIRDLTDPSDATDYSRTEGEAPIVVEHVEDVYVVPEGLVEVLEVASRIRSAVHIASHRSLFCTQFVIREEVGCKACA